MTWKLTWGDVSFTGEDLTVADLTVAHILSAGGWEVSDPTVSPHIAACLIAAVVARVTGRPPMEVIAEIHARPAVELVRAFGKADADPPTPDQP